VQQLISNSTQLSVSVERFAYVAEKLPEQLSIEREEIIKALQTQGKDIASLMEQGTQFSASLNTTFTTFDALMKRFGVGEPKVKSSRRRTPCRFASRTTRKAPRKSKRRRGD
jgi:hypothetical protein